MLARCQATEANFRVIQSQMLESAAKVSKVSKTTWIDEVTYIILISLYLFNASLDPFYHKSDR